jgi:hypothetical protein
LRSLQNIPFKEFNLDATTSAFFNVRGFVVHNFNEDYGVVQTPGAL